MGGGPGKADVVQRWRVVYRRGPGARELAQRAELEAWEAALVASGLPLAVSAGAHPRPRLGTSLPLPVGLTAERELIDLHLVERRTSAEVRDRLGGALPPDHHLVELFDVWTGAPPLAGQVVAADYAITVGFRTDRPQLDDAISALLAAERLERTKRRGDRETAYDLRPFVLALSLDTASPAGGRLLMRLAIHPEAGAGRPDEVLAALSEAMGAPIEVVAGVRERLWTADEAQTWPMSPLDGPGGPVLPSTGPVPSVRPL
jgi:radical SAM-linked protein